MFWVGRKYASPKEALLKVGKCAIDLVNGGNWR